MLPHRRLLSAEPVPIAMTELGIAVAVVRVPLAILLPQQQLGHAFAFEFRVDFPIVGIPEPPLARQRLTGEQHPAQCALIHLRRQWPADVRCPGAGQVGGDGAQAKVQGLRNIPLAESCRERQAEYFFDFSHR